MHAAPGGQQLRQFGLCRLTVPQFDLAVEYVDFTLAVVVDLHRELGAQIDGRVLGRFNGEPVRLARHVGSHSAKIADQLHGRFELEVSRSLDHDGRPAEELDLHQPAFELEFSCRQRPTHFERMLRIAPTCVRRLSQHSHAAHITLGKFFSRRFSCSNSSRL